MGGKLCEDSLEEILDVMYLDWKGDNEFIQKNK